MKACDEMAGGRTRRAKVLFASGLIGLVVAGCTSRGDTAATPAANTTRASSATAPTDLQLVCASEASTRFGVANALPVSSVTTSANTYEVQLSLGEGSAICVIDNNASVLSLTQV